jgi:hypothetical protein
MVPTLDNCIVSHTSIAVMQSRRNDQRGGALSGHKSVCLPTAIMSAYDTRQFEPFSRTVFAPAEHVSCARPALLDCRRPPCCTTVAQRRSIDEQERTGRPLASFHVGKVLCTDEVS